MLKRLKNLDNDHARIAKGALRVAFFLLIGKFAGALKEMAVAGRYGVSDVTDAYQFTMTMSSWLPVTIVGVLSVVLVPVLVQLRYQDEDVQHKFLSQLHGWVIFAGLVLSALTWFVWPWVLQYLAPEFSDQAIAASRELIIAFAPGVLLTLLAGLSTARLRAREKHINTLLDSLPALAILAAIFVLQGDQSAIPLLAGTLCGMLLQTVILYMLAERSSEHQVIPSLTVSSPYWKSMITAAGIMLLGQVASSFVGPLDQMAAARLGDNANATMGYALRLLSLIIGLGAASVGRAALPVLADVQAQGNVRRARNMALKWSVLMFVGGLVVVGVLWVLSPFIVRILFERGAFTADDTRQVAEVLRYGLLQLPGYFGVLVIVQLMASQNRYVLMTAIALANFALKALLNWWLAPKMGLQGIMIATAMMYTLSFICYFWAAVVSRPENTSKKVQ